MTTTAFTDGVTLTAAAWFSDVDTSAYGGLTTIAGTANAITAVGPASMTAYAARQRFFFIPGSTNTGATVITLTCNSISLGSRNIFWNGAACVGGELRSGVPVMIVDDGTRYQIVGPSVSAAQGAAWVLLSTGTASSSATLDFTGLTGYSAYTFLLEHVTPATNAADLDMRISEDNGSTWKAGAANYQYGGVNYNTAGTSGGVGNASATSVALITGLNNGSLEGASGTVTWFDLTVVAEKDYIAQIFGLASSGTRFGMSSGGSYVGDTSTINGVRFLMSSGNIASGIIKCYGVRGT